MVYVSIEILQGPIDRPTTFIAAVHRHRDDGGLLRHGSLLWLGASGRELQGSEIVNGPKTMHVNSGSSSRYVHHREANTDMRFNLCKSC